MSFRSEFPAFRFLDLIALIVFFFLFQQIENIKNCLAFLASIGVSLEGITAKDVREGNLKTILGLFFSLSRHKQRQKHQHQLTIEKEKLQRLQQEQRQQQQQQQNQQEDMPQPRLVMLKS